MNLAQFLNSLSINSCGELTFDMMIEEGYDTLEKIRDMRLLDIANVGKSSKKMIGLKTAHKIWNSLHSERVQDLLQYKDLWVKYLEESEEESDDITFIVKDKVNFKDSLSIQVEDDSELRIDLRGKKVLFTGTGPFSRDALTAILKRNGAIMQSGVTKETDVLIVDDLNSTRNKAKKARKYGTKMVTYVEVFGE